MPDAGVRQGCSAYWALIIHIANCVQSTRHVELAPEYLCQVKNVFLTLTVISMNVLEDFFSFIRENPLVISLSL